MMHTKSLLRDSNELLYSGISGKLIFFTSRTMKRQGQWAQDQLRLRMRTLYGAISILANSQLYGLDRNIWATSFRPFHHLSFNVYVCMLLYIVCYVIYVLSIYQVWFLFSSNALCIFFLFHSPLIYWVSGFISVSSRRFNCKRRISSTSYIE